MGKMKPKKRQKLCHHCEGEVDLDVIVCPFCAADLREEKPEQPRFSAPVSRIKSQAEQNLYPPPYSEPEEEPLPTEEVARVHIPPQAVPEKTTFTLSSPLASLLALALGAQLLFLSLAFLIFSDHGVLLLQFNANWWPLSLILAVALLLFGYRTLKE